MDLELQATPIAAPAAFLPHRLLCASQMFSSGCAYSISGLIVETFSLIVDNFLSKTP
jgi:hypothetical protein